MAEGIFQTFAADIAGEADALRLTGRATLFREESFRISLGTERTLLPGKFNAVGGAQARKYCRYYWA
jgi:hypothetical protein